MINVVVVIVYIFLQVVFFRDNKDFVNCQDHETGNTALHLACRQGHFVSLQCVQVMYVPQI